MERIDETAGLSAGDRVALAKDDWSVIGQNAILVHPEPVPGSTQCVVRVGGHDRTVSRSELRRVA